MFTLASAPAAVKPTPAFSFLAPVAFAPASVFIKPFGLADETVYHAERDILDTVAASYADYLEQQAEDDHYDALADEAMMADAYDFACTHGHSYA